MRVSLRLRLSMAYGALLAVAAAILLGVAVLVADTTVAATPGLDPGTAVEIETVDGTTVTVPAGTITEALRDQARAAILQTGGLAFALVVLAGAAAGYLIAGRVLKPVSELTATAARLSTATLTERINYDGPRDELAELADAFDGMVARLDAAFASQQRFAANASHELRTPLTLIRTEAEVTLADPDAGVAELRECAEVIRLATERADELIESLLILARSEAEAEQGLHRREPVDLATLIAPALAGVGDETSERGIAVATEIAPAPVVGDRELLGRLIGNLVENATRHNVDSGMLQVRCGPGAPDEAGQRQTLLEVTNTGPVLDPAGVSGLLEPFRRGGAGRSGVRGTGLGLSIVRAVVAAHHGTVDLRAVPEGGLAVRVHLPGG